MDKKRKRLGNKPELGKKTEIERQRKPIKIIKKTCIPKNRDYYQDTGNETSCKYLESIIDTPESLDPANMPQPLEIINHIHNIYGNNHLHKIIQKKLKISKSDDIYEQEADRVAEKIILDSENDKTLKSKISEKNVLKAMLKMDSKNYSLKSSGVHIPYPERRFFESRFGLNLNSVHIHNNIQASKLTNILNAKAFTIGRNIFFGPGQYKPNTFSGKRLLAHELTHVIQQNSTGPVNSTKISPLLSINKINANNLIQRKTWHEMTSEEKLQSREAKLEDAMLVDIRDAVSLLLSSPVPPVFQNNKGFKEAQIGAKTLEAVLIELDANYPVLAIMLRTLADIDSKIKENENWFNKANKMGILTILAIKELEEAKKKWDVFKKINIIREIEAINTIKLLMEDIKTPSPSMDPERRREFFHQKSSGMYEAAIDYFLNMSHIRYLIVNLKVGHGKCYYSKGIIGFYFNLPGVTVREDYRANLPSRKKFWGGFSTTTESRKESPHGGRFLPAVVGGDTPTWGERRTHDVLNFPGPLKAGRGKKKPKFEDLESLGTGLYYGVLSRIDKAGNKYPGNHGIIIVIANKTYVFSVDGLKVSPIGTNIMILDEWIKKMQLHYTEAHFNLWQLNHEKLFKDRNEWGPKYIGLEPIDPFLVPDPSVWSEQYFHSGNVERGGIDICTDLKRLAGVLRSIMEFQKIITHYGLSISSLSTERTESSV